MAVVIEMSYTKKLGLPEYSSHSFGVGLKSEVPDLDKVEAEVERVYRILQSAVDQQITHSGFVPGQNGGNGGNGNHGREKGAWKCSERQRDLLLKLVDEHHLDRTEVDQLAHQRFDKGVTSLNKLEMSGLIDEIIESHGGPRRGNPGRRFHTEGRRAA